LHDSFVETFFLKNGTIIMRIKKFFS